jgi:polygalacturonase
MTRLLPLAGFAILLCLVTGCSSTATFNVREFGAKGDGVTNDTESFQAALKMCAGFGGTKNVLVVPPGNYLIGSIVLPSGTTLMLSKDTTLTGSPNKDDYPLRKVRWEGRIRDGHQALIFAENATDVGVVGPGTINGATKLGYLRHPRGPCVIEFIECKGIRLDGFNVNYERMWAIHPTFSQDISIKNLTIRSTKNNGDGIDVDSCKNVRIEGCDIDTGDDAIALKSGRGTEGFTMNRPTENVHISACKLGADFAGLAIGTEMSGGIRNIRFERCTFTRGSNSIFIKSRVGRGGVIEDIVGKDLDARATSFLRFDLFGRGVQDEEPVQGPQGVPECRNVRLENVRTTCPVFIDAADVSPDKPVDGLTLVNVSGSCNRPIEIGNVSNMVWKNVTVKVPRERSATTRATTRPATTATTRSSD